MSISTMTGRPILVAASLALLTACAPQPMQQSEINWAPDPTPAVMSQTPMGDVLTTPTGMTLYTFDRDIAGRSNCNEGCVQYWPPLMASSNSVPVGNMTLITRADGRMQWATENGLPLYTYIDDQRPGDTNGNNYHDDWHVVM